MVKIQADCLPGINWYCSRPRPIEYCLSTTCWASVTDLAALDHTSMRLSAGAVGRVLVSPWVRHQTSFFPRVALNIWLHFHLLYSHRDADWCCLEATLTVVRGKIRHLSPTEIEKYWINRSEERKETFTVLFSCGELSGLMYYISKLRLCFCAKNLCDLKVKVI